MIVLGIDPGISNLGIGVVQHIGKTTTLLHAEVVLTKNADPAPHRVGLIGHALEAAILAHNPDAIAVEDQFFYRQNEMAYKIGWAMGAVMLVANRHGLSIYGYAPTKVKQAIVGTGRADKDQVAYMVAAILKLPKPPSPSHLADAVAIAITHCFQPKGIDLTPY